MHVARKLQLDAYNLFDSRRFGSIDLFMFGGASHPAKWLNSLASRQNGPKSSAVQYK
jgi:hypothetical protein